MRHHGITTTLALLRSNQPKTVAPRCVTASGGSAFLRPSRARADARPSPVRPPPLYRFGKKSSPPRPMKKHPLTIRCQKYRENLIEQLKSSGHWCGHPGPVQLDCIEARGHWHHVTGSYQRIKFYEQQARRGNLQALCVHCHNEKSRRESRERKYQRMHDVNAHVRAWHLHNFTGLIQNYDQP